MNYSQKEERVNTETSMDLALEKFFNNVLECIVVDEKVFKL